MKLPNPYTQRKLAEARDLPPRNGPFAKINVGFHETYTLLVEQVLAQLGDSVPVVVLIGDDATLLCDGKEQREPVIPARYHELKALGHLAFGVQLTLMANGSGRLTELTASKLHEKRAQIREVQAAINASPAYASSSPTMKGPAELLCRARTLVDRVLAEGVVDFERLHEHVRALASYALETAQLACASSSNHSMRSSDGGAKILVKGLGPACTSSSAALTSRGIARQRASTSGVFSTSPKARAPSGRIDLSTPRASATSTPRSTCSRDTSLTSGPRISSSATGGVFRRTFLPTLPAQKCGNSSRKCAVAPVALTGGRNETLSVPATCLELPKLFAPRNQRLRRNPGCNHVS
jgi:hypothetical protein